MKTISAIVCILCVCCSPSAQAIDLINIGWTGVATFNASVLIPGESIITYRATRNTDPDGNAYVAVQSYNPSLNCELIRVFKFIGATKTWLGVTNLGLTGAVEYASRAPKIPENYYKYTRLLDISVQKAGGAKVCVSFLTYLASSNPSYNNAYLHLADGTVQANGNWEKDYLFFPFLADWIVANQHNNWLRDYNIEAKAASAVDDAGHLHAAYSFIYHFRRSDIEDGQDPLSTVHASEAWYTNDYGITPEDFDARHVNLLKVDQCDYGVFKGCRPDYPPPGAGQDPLWMSDIEFWGTCAVNGLVGSYYGYNPFISFPALSIAVQSSGSDVTAYVANTCSSEESLPVTSLYFSVIPVGGEQQLSCRPPIASPVDNTAAVDVSPYSSSNPTLYVWLAYSSTTPTLTLYNAYSCSGPNFETFYQVNGTTPGGLERVKGFAVRGSSVRTLATQAFVYDDAQLQLYGLSMPGAVVTDKYKGEGYDNDFQNQQYLIVRPGLSISNSGTYFLAARNGLAMRWNILP